MDSPPVDLAPGVVRVVVVVLALVTAVGAAGGAWSLIVTGMGDVDAGATRLGTLGLTSWVPGGWALVAGVSVPMAVTGLLLWTGHAWGPLLAILSGMALVTWIVVQVTYIGLVSWLQPTFLLVGAAVAAGGVLLVRAG